MNHVDILYSLILPQAALSLTAFLLCAESILKASDASFSASSAFHHDCKVSIKIINIIVRLWSVFRFSLEAPLEWKCKLLKFFSPPDLVEELNQYWSFTLDGKFFFGWEMKKVILHHSRHSFRWRLHKEQRLSLDCYIIQFNIRLKQQTLAKDISLHSQQ